MGLNIRGRSFLTLLDFTPEEINYLIDLAVEFKRLKNNGVEHKWLSDKQIVLLFEKTSTRTRCAFEVGARDLGMGVTFLDSGSSQMGKKESLADTAKVLGRMFDGIEYRGFKQSVVEDLAKYSGVPVWNGLTDQFHPTQMLADLLTIAQHRGGVDALPGKTIAYLGDSANNMANSYLLGGATAGMNVRIAGPFGYLPDPAIVADAERIAAENGGSILVTTDPREAVADADCIFTDTWVSMGEEAEYAIRSKPFRDYQVNDELMALAKPDALFQHCLPAYRGKEVTASVIDGPQSVVWDEAENRLHAQKALLTWLIGQQRGDESLLA